MNASVKYNGGFLPDIILLTQRFYHRGTPFKCHEEVCLCNEVHRQVRRKKERTKKKKKKKKKKAHDMVPPKRFDIFPPDWGMLIRSRRIQVFLQTTTAYDATETL